MPIDWKTVSNHLETMFPGIGNRINPRNDSMMVMQHSIDNRSTSSSLMNYPDTRISPVYDFDPYEVPEKRYKLFTDSHTTANNNNTQNATVCREDLNSCMQNIIGIMNNVFNSNEKIETKMKNMIERHAIEMKTVHEKNTYLMSQNDSMMVMQHFNRNFIIYGMYNSDRYR